MEFLIKKNSTYMLGCSILACQSLFGTTCWKDCRVEIIHNALDFSTFEKPFNLISFLFERNFDFQSFQE